MWEARGVSMSDWRATPLRTAAVGPWEGEARTFSSLHLQLLSSLHCTTSHLQRRPQVHPRGVGPVLAECHSRNGDI